MTRTGSGRARRDRRAHAWVWWAALAVLICAGAAAIPASLVHTDDGCAVEIHCLACRWAYNAQVVFVEIPTPVAVHDVPELVEASVASLLSEVRVDRPSPRGPPAA